MVTMVNMEYFLIWLLGKDALNWSKVTMYMVTFISNKYCSFELKQFFKNIKQMFSVINILIIK